MTEFFEEKSQQVKPESLMAFGIQIISRYGKADELVEMLKFTKLVAKRGIEKAVKEVFYDSKACLCSFKLSPFVQEHDEIAAGLQVAAQETIRQFLWFGSVEHGADCVD